MTRTEQHWTTIPVILVVVAFGGVLPVVDAYTRHDESETISRDGRIDVQLDNKRTATMSAPANWTVTDTDSPANVRLTSNGAFLSLRLVPAATDDDCLAAGADAAQTLSAEFGTTANGASQLVLLAGGGTGALTGYSSGLVNSVTFLACTVGAALVATATEPAGARTAPLDDLDAILATVQFP